MRKQDEIRRYELAEDVTSVRLGSLVIDANGIETSDRREIALLDECPSLVLAEPKKPAKREAAE